MTITTKAARTNIIIVVIGLTIGISALFFLFAYIQKLSNAEKATEENVKRVEQHWKDAERHIWKQDSTIQVLKNQVKQLEKSKP